jgi:putative ABC transport system permease protein
MRAVGATANFVSLNFAMAIGLMTLIGIALGVMLGLGLQAILLESIKGLFPVQIPFLVSTKAMWDSMLIGTSVTALFSLVPLYRLRNTRPISILNQTVPNSDSLSSGVILILTIAIMSAFLFWTRLPDSVSRISLYLGTGLFFAVNTTIIAGLLKLFEKRMRLRAFAARMALKSLFRPHNNTFACLFTLTTALSVLFAMYLISSNLKASYVEAFPVGTPNLFILDIQKQQTARLSEILGPGAQFYPVIRAHLTALNDRPIDRNQEKRRQGDNLARTFNLSYRDKLLEDEYLLEGSGLFRKDWNENQVSILDRVGRMGSIDIGDRLLFNIQGVPLEARVASIRSRTGHGLAPFFYFVFPEEVLRSAPQTYFTALYVPNQKIAPLQNRIADVFPNLSIIDISSVLARLAQLMDRLIQVLSIFSFLGFLCGCLTLVSSIVATRLERNLESLHYQIVGASRGFIGKVLVIENSIIGIISAMVSIAYAQVGASLICKKFFDIAYQPYLILSTGILLLVIGAVIVVGIIPARSLWKKKPAILLRQAPDF